MGSQINTKDEEAEGKAIKRAENLEKQEKDGSRVTQYIQDQENL